MIETCVAVTLGFVVLSLPGAVFGGDVIGAAALTSLTWTMALMAGWWRYEHRDDA